MSLKDKELRDMVAISLPIMDEETVNDSSEPVETVIKRLRLHLMRRQMIMNRGMDEFIGRTKE